MEHHLPDRTEPETPPVHHEVGETLGTMEDIERQTILAALDRNDGNRTATAQELGISLRTLYYRLAEYQRRGFLPNTD